MFSICDQRSFDRIRYYRESINLLAVTNSITIPIIILANKSDFEDDRVVKKHTIEDLKANVNCVIETSIRTNQGTDKVLQTAIQLLETNLTQTRNSKHSQTCIII